MFKIELFANGVNIMFIREIQNFFHIFFASNYTTFNIKLIKNQYIRRNSKLRFFIRNSQLHQSPSLPHKIDNLLPKAPLIIRTSINNKVLTHAHLLQIRLAISINNFIGPKPLQILFISPNICQSSYFTAHSLQILQCQVAQPARPNNGRLHPLNALFLSVIPPKNRRKHSQTCAHKRRRSGKVHAFRNVTEQFFGNLKVGRVSAEKRVELICYFPSTSVSKSLKTVCAGVAAVSLPPRAENIPFFEIFHLFADLSHFGDDFVARTQRVSTRVEPVLSGPGNV